MSTTENAQKILNLAEQLIKHDQEKISKLSSKKGKTFISSKKSISSKKPILNPTIAPKGYQWNIIIFISLILLLIIIAICVGLYFYFLKDEEEED